MYSDLDVEVESSCFFSEAEIDQNLVDTTIRTQTVEWNNFISKVALKLNISSTERSRDPESKSYVADHLLVPRLKENNGLPLDGSVIRTQTVEWNNFISKVALKLNISSTERSRDQELKSYVADHLLVPRLKENNGLPLDGSVIRTLEEMNTEWQVRRRVRWFKTSDDQKYIVSKDHFDKFCFSFDLRTLRKELRLFLAVKTQGRVHTADLQADPQTLLTCALKSWIWVLGFCLDRSVTTLWFPLEEY